jgi:hypothetical protein
MMLDFLVAATLAAQAPYIQPDPSYDALGFTSKTAGCVAKFDNGTLEVRQAYNREAGTIIDVAVITLGHRDDFVADEHMTVGQYGGQRWNARVISKMPNKTSIAFGIRVLGDLVIEESIWLQVYDQKAPEKTTNRQIFLIDTKAQSRKKIVELLECADGLGI